MEIVYTIDSMNKLPKKPNPEGLNECAKHKLTREKILKNLTIERSIFHLTYLYQ